ncbi:MAG: hypothetical protein WHW07_09185, partial [Bacteroidales bacterium]
LAQETSEKKFKSVYELNELSVVANSSIYNFYSKYSTHFYQIAEISPLNSQNSDSSMMHDNIFNISIGCNFNKQLFNSKSSLFGNININMLFATGGKIKLIYQNIYNSYTDSIMFEEYTIKNVDTTIVNKFEYTYKSSDIGIDIQYKIGTDPKNILTFNTGIGFSFLFPFNSKVIFQESQSISIRYINQYNKNQYFQTLNTNNNELLHTNQVFMKLYLPVILSYKIDNKNKYSLSTYINGGLDIQHPIKGEYFAYPFFSIGIGMNIKL